MIDRLRYAPWTSVLLFAAVVTVPTVGSLWVGHEIVTWLATAGTVDAPMEMGYILGWCIGSLGILGGLRISQLDRVEEWWIPGWIYLETLVWPLHGEDSDES